VNLTIPATGVLDAVNPSPAFRDDSTTTVLSHVYFEPSLVYKAACDPSNYTPFKASPAYNRYAMKSHDLQGGSELVLDHYFVIVGQGIDLLMSAARRHDRHSDRPMFWPSNDLRDRSDCDE
jgi:hypothetical protein